MPIKLNLKCTAISELRPTYSFTTLLKISKVSRQTYFNHVKRKDFDVKNLEIIQEIERIYFESNGYYGYRRITDELKNLGYRINHKKVQRLMGKMKLKPDPYSSYKGQSDTLVENLIQRHFVASRPNEKWASDVTEFHCYWGNLYLSAILDLYSKDIVSYSISMHPDFHQIQEMMDRAFEKYPNVDGLILHTDMGWQYTYYKYIEILKKHNIVQSMSKKGNCLDNAVMESFFSVLKREMYYGRELIYKSFGELKSAIENYIKYYNEKRIKHGLNGKTPKKFREDFLPK